MATRRRPHPLAAGALAAGVLCGCATFASDPEVDAPTLPQPLVTPFAGRIGVHFSAAFRNAHGDTSLAVDNGPVVWRHRVGPAGLAVFRQALRGAFAGVDELAQMPSPATAEPGRAAVLVPAAPVLRGEWVGDAGAWRYAQSIRYAVALHAPSGAVLAQWTVEGTASADGDARQPLRQQPVDQGLLRNAGAALIASLYRPPALAALAALGAAAAEPPGAAATPPAASAGPGLAVLRLDAGLSVGDALERRVADCLRPLQPGGVPAPAALRDAAFPWFEPGLLPPDPDGVTRLLARPLLQQRLQRLGIGRLLLFTAQTARLATGESPLPTQSGVLGPDSALASEAIDAALWDVASQRRIAEVRSTFVRTTRRLGGLLPIPVVSSNEAQVCARLRAVVRDAPGTPP